MNTLYEKRYINFVSICPKTAPSQGYTMCKYVHWIGMHGRLGDKNNCHKILHVYLSKAHLCNLSRNLEVNANNNIINTLTEVIIFVITVLIEMLLL